MKQSRIFKQKIFTFVIYFSLFSLVYITYAPLSEWYESHPRASTADPLSFKEFFKPALTPHERSLFLETLKAFDDAMKSANISYFVIEGTLLGTYRHHGPIPWDDDADVIIPWKDSFKAYKALGQYDPERFGVYAGLGVSLSSLLFKSFENDEKQSDFNFQFASKIYQWKFYPYTGKKVLIWPYRHPYVDIFFYQENSTHLLATSKYFPLVYAKNLVYPLVSRPFDDFQVMSPCRIQDLLKSLKIDSTACMSRSFNHKVDIPILTSAANIPCSLLSGTVPFVNRTIIERDQNGSKRTIESITIKETLVLNGKVLKEFYVPGHC